VSQALAQSADHPVATPLDYRANPFTLVYDGALTRNEPGKVNIHPVTYKVGGIDIVANVYTPATYDPAGRHAAIVVAHPNGGVKEQTAGLYAQHLAGRGFIAMTMDAAYQGGSGGMPRSVDKPQNRIEDIHGAADFITAFPVWTLRAWACWAFAAVAVMRWRRPRPTSASRRLPRSACSIPGACAGTAFRIADGHDSSGLSRLRLPARRRPPEARSSMLAMPILPMRRSRRCPSISTVRAISITGAPMPIPARPSATR
jgi:hypothetical protein